MCCELRSPCHSKTRETSIPMHGAALGCKTQEDYGEPMSQNYGSVLQRLTTYYNVRIRYYSRTTMELRLSSLVVAAHETFFTLRGVTYGMQNTMELRHSCWVVKTHETSFAMRGAQAVTFHQEILRLPGKMIFMFDPRRTWTSSTISRTTEITLQPHQMLRSPRKMAFVLNLPHTWNVHYNKPSNRNHLQHHQMLRLPRKMTFMLDSPHTWRVHCNAWSNRGHPPTSPNIAPATNHYSHWYWYC